MKKDNLLHIIIVDDEPKASEVLKSMLKRIDLKIEVLAVVHDSRKAKSIIEQHEVDVLFLDVDMPFMTGFDVLESIVSPSFEVIFVTGHNQYAIDAFRYTASGYILKPIDYDDLQHAVAMAVSRLNQKSSAVQNKILISNLISNQDKSLGVPTMKGLDFVQVSKIIRCEGDQKCTKVYVEEGRAIVSSYNIGEFIRLLEPFGFFVAHKSHLINLNKISKYYKEGNIEMIDGSVIPLARRRKMNFLNVITKLK